MSLLELNDVSVRLRGAAPDANLVTGMSLKMDRGDALCLVGESGSGKTVTALSIMRLLEYTAPVQVRGDIRFNGQVINDLTQRDMARIRGDGMAMIFQECMEALNPTARIGTQLVQAWRYHQRERQYNTKRKHSAQPAARHARQLSRKSCSYPQHIASQVIENAGQKCSPCQPAHRKAVHVPIFSRMRAI